MKRRQFLSGLSMGVAGATLAGASITTGFAGRPQWRSMPRSKAPVQVRNTARNLIFILLEGGPSHVDTFDLKTGSWTPNLLGVQDFGGGVLWPSGIMPKLAQRTDKFSVVRSISAVEAVHERAVYHLITAHRPNQALVEEIPHFASVISYKLANQRRPGDSLPTVMKVGDFGPGNGFFSVDHLGITLDESGSVNNLDHQIYDGERRLQLLDDFIGGYRQTTDSRNDYKRFQLQAREMMEDTTLASLLGNAGEGEDDPEEGEVSSFRTQCETAVKVIEADKGTRVFQMSLFGWDHHENIYAPEALPALATALDDGIAYMIDELSSKPGTQGGTLLDETLIMAAGEFGRTTAHLNTSAGRDHYPYVMPALFAGGGVQPNRFIGASNVTGDVITDPGWSQSRYMSVNDLMATVYSAMGIDWTERFADTPSGRVFEIVDSNLTGDIHEIDTLFS
jgi:hypothetical protein